MHLHALPHSTDSFITLEQIATCAKARGLDAVCITDHDSMGIRDYAAEFTQNTGYPVFVGIEYYSLWGDITAYGLDMYPHERVSTQQFIDLVNAQGGFCSACHPFRNNKRGLEEHLADVRGLHAVEVLNGSTPMDTNRIALEWAKRLGLKTIGSSDAHVERQVGKYATWLPDYVDNMADLVGQLHATQPRPAIWNGSGYDVVERF